MTDYQHNAQHTVFEVRLYLFGIDFKRERDRTHELAVRPAGSVLNIPPERALGQIKQSGQNRQIKHDHQPHALAHRELIIMSFISELATCGILVFGARSAEVITVPIPIPPHKLGK